MIETVRISDIQKQPPLDESLLSLKHLRAELVRIDLLIRREVRRWRLAGQDPNDDYRGMYVAPAEVDLLLDQDFATSWGQQIALDPAEDHAFAEAEVEATAQAEALVETARQQGFTPRLLRLAETFGLSRLELDILLICLAPAFDPRYDRLYGYLQDNVNRRRPLVRLILHLLGTPGPEQFALAPYFEVTAPLFKYELLSHITERGAVNPHWLNQTLQPDEMVVAWLMGTYRPNSALSEAVTLDQPQADDTDNLLSEPVWPRLSEALAGQPVLVFHGPDAASQQATARRLAAQLCRPLLTVDLAALIQSEISPLRVVRLALRDAHLTGAIPLFIGWAACLSDGSPAPLVLNEICTHPDPVILVGETAWQPRGLTRHRPLLWLEFLRPAYPQRRQLWAHFLEITDHSSLLTPHSPLDLDAIAGRFILTSGQIRDAVASARDLAFARSQELGVRSQELEAQGTHHASTSQPPISQSPISNLQLPITNYQLPITTTDLFTAARTHSSPRLSGLAQQIKPRYGWADLVLPGDQMAMLRELVGTVRGRPQVLEAWGIGHKLAASAGVTVLFAGPPGTGKTMAAEVIATELGLDLFKIDLASVVSKYIGETEKNLERIFNEAEASNVILFFDEADALFGKRSEVRDAHDRYANIEISYLLQRMERYDGVTILATNLGGNMDDAFTRRLQFALDFPFPEEPEQRQIWQTLFPADVPHPPDLDLDRLATRFNLAGGNIRNILVSAAYLAANDGGQVTMEHLLHGTRRELQKMGRLVDEEALRG